MSMHGVLGEAPEGSEVVSTAWTNFTWGQEVVPRELIVVEHVKGTETTMCRAADGLTTGLIPLWSGLPCAWRMI